MAMNTLLNINNAYIIYKLMIDISVGCNYNILSS